ELLWIGMWSAVLSGAANDAGGAGLSRPASARGCDSVVAAGIHSGREHDDSSAADGCAGNANDHSCGNEAEPEPAAGDVGCAGGDWRNIHAAAGHDRAGRDDSGAAWFWYAGSWWQLSGSAAERQLWNGNELSAGERSLYDADASGAAEPEWRAE